MSIDAYVDSTYAYPLTPWLVFNITSKYVPVWCGIRVVTWLGVEKFNAQTMYFLKVSWAGWHFISCGSSCWSWGISLLEVVLVGYDDWNHKQIRNRMKGLFGFIARVLVNEMIPSLIGWRCVRFERFWLLDGEIWVLSSVQLLRSTELKRRVGTDDAFRLWCGSVEWMIDC